MSLDYLPGYRLGGRSIDLCNADMRKILLRLLKAAALSPFAPRNFDQNYTNKLFESDARAAKNLNSGFSGVT